MADQSCPRCKTTKYRNPSLKLMVNVCGHALCENCVELLFVRGSGSCPQCSVALRRNNFRVQLFEDAFVEKDTDIRKRVLRDFNKREEEFSCLREYNDYLEEVETIIFNLTNGIDTEETRERIETYKQENKESIRKNRAKQSHEDEYLEDLIEQEKQEKEKARELHLREEMQEKKEKLKSKEALIDNLISSDLPADHILAQHKHEQDTHHPTKQTKRVVQFSSGIQIGKQDAFMPIPKMPEAELFSYSPLIVEFVGPKPPDDPELDQYLRHMRSETESEKGGGYLANIGCKRALQEAFCGLFFTLHKDLLSERVSPYMDIS